MKRIFETKRLVLRAWEDSDAERYAFEELGQTGLWCSYNEGNEKSRKCMEKCGFRYDHTEMTKAYAMGEKEETVCYEHLRKDEWMNCNEL